MNHNHMTAAKSQYDPNDLNKCLYPQFLNTVCDSLMTGRLLVNDVYDVTHELRELSAQRVSLSTGTLYGALKRLLTRKWVARLAPVLQR